MSLRVGKKLSRAERGPEPAPVSRTELVGVVLGALVAFALAFFSPADDTSADPGLALLVSQRMLEGGSAWLGDPALADDYRVQSGVYYGWGVPVLSMPAVWTARRLGYDMRRPADEKAVQNLLSALCCGALFVLVHLLARSRAGPRAAAVIAAVCVFGSPLMSTLATGLWNSAYATVLLAAALLFWARRGDGGLLLPASMIGLAGLCRPTAGFFALGAGAFLLARGRRRLAAAAVVAVVAAAAAVWLIGWDEVLFYYSPRRLLNPRAEPLAAAVGLLLSPGRGLLVYCPFVAVVAAALAARRRALREPLVVLALVWLGSQLVGLALRPRWWGGHSFGPRYFTEVLPGVALVAAIAWRGLESVPARRRWGAAFVATGLVALALHSGIALSNPWAAWWNSEPDVDRHPELLWSFAYPPFLSTASRHEARLVSFQRRTRRAYRLGEWIGADSDLAAFGGFSAPEAAEGGVWRWTRRRRAAIFLDLPSGAPGEPLCALELRAGAHGAQSVTVRLGEVTIGDLRLRGFARQRRLLGFDCSLLDRPEGEVEVVFELPDTRPAPGDPRLLGLALDALRLASLVADGEATWDEDVFFGDGFSSAESPDGRAGWRWTDGADARLWLPVSGEFDAVELEGWSHGRQSVRLSWDGVPLGVREIDAGVGRRSWRWPVAAGLSQSIGPQPPGPRLIELRLELSDPHPAPGDARRLGFALVRARILDAPP